MIKRFLSSVITWDSQQYNLGLITMEMVILVFRIKMGGMVLGEPRKTGFFDIKLYLFALLEELMPIANLGSKRALEKRRSFSPILVCNKDSVQEVCVVRLASSSNAYIGMILYVYWGGSTGLFFINSKTGNSYIIRKVNGSMISEIEFKRKNDHLFVRSKTNTASFRVSALFFEILLGVDLSLSM